ncbi:transmembrane domain-containing protein, partial [Cryptosporidium canis]
MLGSNASSGLQSITDNSQFTGLRNIRQNKSIYPENILINSNCSINGSSTSNSCSSSIISGLNSTGGGNGLSSGNSINSRAKDDDLYISSGSGKMLDKYWRSSTDFWNDLECGIVYPDYSSSNIGRNSFTSSQISSGQYTHPFGLFSVSIHPVLTRKNALAIFYSFIPYIIGIVLFVWLLIGDSFIPAYALIMMLGSSASSEFFLKNIFKSPRPPNSACASYGMPSSHCVTSYSILMWLLLENINALGFVSGVMSKDEDEIGECLLDELAREHIDFNIQEDHKDILNEDDEIKKFFESYEQRDSKIGRGGDKGEQILPECSSDIPSLNGSILVGGEESNKLEPDTQFSSDLVEANSKNKNGDCILSKFRQSHKEFIDSVMSFVGSQMPINGNNLDSKEGGSNKSGSLVNSTNRYNRNEMTATGKFKNNLIRQSTDADPNECFVEKNKTIFNQEMSNRATDSIVKVSHTLESKGISSTNLTNKKPFLLKMSGLISSRESKELDERFDSNKNFEVGNSSVFHFSNTENQLRTYEEVNTNPHNLNLTERFNGSTKDNLHISFSTGSGKTISIDEESLNR